MNSKKISFWFTVLMTWFILSALCFSVSIVTHLINFFNTLDFQYLAVFFLIPVVFSFVYFFIAKKITFEEPEDYSPEYIDTTTFIESCAIKWAKQNTDDKADYILLVANYENIAKDLLKDIQWKNAWFERPLPHKEILILDNLDKEIKMYKGYLSDIEKIGQPHFWMYFEDFKKYFIIKNYKEKDASLDNTDTRS